MGGLEGLHIIYIYCVGGVESVKKFRCTMLDLLEGPGDVFYIFINLYFQLGEAFLKGFVDGDNVFTLKADDDAVRVFGVDAFEESKVEGVADEELHHKTEGDVHATFVVC